MAHRVVLADISQSVCRLASMASHGDDRPVFYASREMQRGDYANFYDMLEAYLSEGDDDAWVKAVAISLQGPVYGDVVRPLHTDWVIDRAELTSRFGIDHFVAMNNIAAIASAIPWLDERDAIHMGGACAAQSLDLDNGRFGVIGLTAGMGVAALKCDSGNVSIIDTESGHTAFAPQDDLQSQIVARLRSRFGFISREDILSFSGIERIYEVLSELEGDRPATLTALEILMYGKTDADPLCRKTLDVFFDALASIAGDICLELCAKDGVFLYGEIVSRALDALPQDRFRTLFEDKGKFGVFVASTPTLVMQNPSTGLIGLARQVAESIATLEAGRLNQSQHMRAASRYLDQSLTVINQDLQLVAMSRENWYDLPQDKSLVLPGTPALDYFTALETAGQFDGHITADDIVAKLKSTEPFMFKRFVFGSRVLECKAYPTPEGGFAIVETDRTEMERRTIELEELAIRLRSEKDRSDCANRAKSEFVANMSHEIRTPLNGVLGMADVLSRTPLESGQKEMLDVISNSGNALLTVINDILDFSKIEAGKMRLQEQPMHLRVCVDDVAAMLAAGCEAKGVELMTRFRPSTPEWVIGDAGRIRQVMTNLLGNAVKFTQSGHVLLDISGTAEGPHAELQIDVTDTGCGIPEDKLEAIFGSFEQVDGSSTRVHQGTGLGLSITRRIVQLMGGNVTVTSTVGKGSTFSVHLRLPLAEEAAQSAEPIPLGDLKGKTVLVVDDQPVNRAILKEQLGAWGVDTLLAESAKAGLEILRKAAKSHEAIDAAILDYQMPDTDGIALARDIKADPRISGLPLILLTSVGNVVDNPECDDLDFKSCLVKPARSESLRQALQSAVSPHYAKENALASQETPATDDVPAPVAAEKAPLMLTAEIEDNATADAEPSTAPASADMPAPAKLKSVADEMRRKAPDAVRAALHRSQKKSAKPAAGEPLRVLIAEDNAVNRLVIKAMLDPAQYELRLAVDGEDAVAQFIDETPDVILMDVSMPALDGLSATRKIRGIEKDHGAGRTPIIGLTAHALPEDRQNCIDAGMDGYLTKPVTKERLEETISQVLQRDGARASA
ncbi:glucokinase [Parvularcula sp. LCG005]|uniref:glucokinase n=1 Tax=Parvularcula sp. LCG005 TaxID=3078805 RepID=UPI002943BCC8|nr:glucokinase [Parvularcula sp. LCG005]WOI54237.1 glucokinase [Parvularcula sp. LCG005]